MSDTDDDERAQGKFLLDAIDKYRGHRAALQTDLMQKLGEAQAQIDADKAKEKEQ